VREGRLVETGEPRVTSHDAPKPPDAHDEATARLVRRPLALSAEAVAGDLSALARDAAAAGWRLKVTQREPYTRYANDVEIELSIYEEAGGGTPHEAWFGPPDERGTREMRPPERPDAWYAERTTRVTGAAPTVARACAMLAEAVERYEAGLEPRPVME
jgi:hypothetical protein